MKVIKSKIFFLLIILIISKIICDNDSECTNCDPDSSCLQKADTTGNCNENCRKSLISSDQFCHICNFENSNQYYSIKEDRCIQKSKCGDEEKIIEGTFECIESCGTHIEMGDFCYTGSTIQNAIPIDSTSSNKYKCEYKYYEEKDTNGKLKLICLGENDECPSPFKSYNYHSKQCSTEECSFFGLNYKQKRETDSDIIRCSRECLDSEYLKTTVLGTNIIYECVNSCNPDLEIEIDSFKKECISQDDCRKNGLYKKDNTKCVDVNECDYYHYNNECISDCRNIGLHILQGKKECSECKEPYKYLYLKTGDSNDNTCYLNCPSGYIQSNGHCFTEDTSNCYQVESEDPKVCYNNECNEEYKYHDAGSKICHGKCELNINGYNYYKENDNICYQSCKDIVSLTTRDIYQNGYICSNTPCSLYKTIETINSNSKLKRCYTEEECIQNNFLYIRGGECLNTCENNDFKVEFIKNLEGKITNLGICFSNINECITNGYHFYNSQRKECWKNSCPSDMYTNQLDVVTTFPKESEGNTCVIHCNSDFPRLSGKFCKLNCNNSNEFYDPDSFNSNECKTNCGDKYIQIISGENTCVSEANCNGKRFYIKESGLIECMGEHVTCESRSDGYKYYFNDDKQCYNRCSKKDSNGNLINYFYNPSTQYQCLYTCKENADDNKFAEEPKDQPEQCINIPNGKFYYEEDKIIRDDCILYKNDSPDNNICVKQCRDGEKVYNNKCMENCPSEAPYYYEKTIEFGDITSQIKICTSDCKDISSDYKYILRNNNKCMKDCPNDYYYKVGDSCYLKCSANVKFLVGSNFQCSSECTTNIYEKLSDDYRDIYLCKENCQNKPYFVKSGTKKECFSECPRNFNFIQNDNECKINCPDSLYSKYIIEAKRESYNIFKCINKCPDDYYYSEKEHLCFSNCLDSSINKFSLTDTDGIRKCSFKCVKSDNVKLYYKEENKICMPNCDQDSEYKYNIENEYICLKDCPQGYHIEENKFVKNCGNAKPYLDEDKNECVQHCPSIKKFYIGIDIKKRCLSDCTNEYPYYIINDDEYECKHDCSGVILINNDNKIGKKCLSTTANCPFTGAEIYPYEYMIEGKKQCYSTCPSEKYYIDYAQYSSIPNSYLKKCLDECPPEYYFHEKGSYKCIKPEDCQSKIANYNTKICVSECKNNYISEIKDGTTLKATICLSSCNSNYGPYLTPDKKCVSDCPTYSNYLINDNSFKCLCQNLYYYDESNKMICIQPSILNCKSNTGDLAEYKISKAESNECLKKCNGILSVNDDICYEDTYDCTQNDIKTELIIQSNGQKKCECKYKYFYDNGIKTCFNEDEDCSPGTLYIPETNGCVSSCITPYIKKFDSFCLRKCPDRANENSNICTCNHYWYSLSNQNFICLDVNECPKSHPLLILTTKQCIKECRESLTNDILIIDKCVSSCGNSDISPYTSKNPIPTFLSEYKYANYYCLCNNVWYYDISQNKNICSPTENTCPSFYPDSKYIIKDTKQCVISCPDAYPYSFNSICLHTCELHKEEYWIQSVENSKVCQCINLWKYDSDNNIVCIKTDYCPNSPEEYVQIIENKECLKGNACPRESPLFFNKKCYKINNCPENSHYNSTIEGTCVCDNLWYHYIDVNINIQFTYCLPKNSDRCPMHSNEKYPYQIFRTKECLKEGTNCPQNSYVFNYICYENSCPKNTIEDTDKYDSINQIHFCKCDTTAGYWYKYSFDESNRDYLQCGLEKCEGEFFNLYINDDECLKTCSVKRGENNEPMVSFRGICYDECPDFTKPKEDFIYECWFYKLNEANNLEQLRDYANIQVRELYETSNIGGYLYNNSQIFMQIYGIDKLNNKNSKNIIMKSNLAYVDLGTCTEKVFEDNKLSDDDRILVVKYDMLSINIKKSVEEEAKTIDDENQGTNVINDNSNNNINQYLINPIEYEFFSSITGEKIDASVCQPNEISISYPISYTLNKYNVFEDGMKKNEYKKKFDIGKELNNKNNKIDVYNFNNTVYKDVCLGVEINGKDLVLEDRYENLYPNNLTLCENNCTYDYTDYQLGRINCKCNYKNELDFYREHPESSDLLGHPDFNNPKQSGANAEIIKCLSKLPSKNSIINNEAFYYSAAITVAEISMIFVAAFHGIKSVSANITSLMSKANIKMDVGNKKLINRSKFKNDNNIITTSNRPLNNPPRKINIIKSNVDEKNNKDEKKNENLSNIIISKNIEIINSKKNDNNIINNEDIIDNNNTDDFENNSINNDIKYDIRIKKLGISSNFKNSINILEDKEKDKNAINYNYIGKTEFMPIEYNFKYFKLSDKGIIKKMERSKIPFKVKPTTKYLLERKEGINYDKNYLNGPFLPSQNIIEIIEENYEEIINNENNQYIYTSKNIINNTINNENNNNVSEYQKTRPKIRTLKNSQEISNEKDFITIKKIKPIRKNNENEFIIQDYKDKKEENDIYDNTGLYTLIKKEQTLLRAPYNRYLEKSQKNILSIFLAEIIDKIYLLKICLFLKKFDIFSVHLTLYLIYHLMLLTLLCAFFTIKVIKKIWNESNFPQLNFYLLYGFLGNVVIWVIYRIFLCLLNSQDRVKKLLKLQAEVNGENKENSNFEDLSENNQAMYEESVEKEYIDVIKGIKIRTAIFFIIGFLITAFCFIYLVTFFAIYTGTKSKVFKMYYISLIEIVLIKIVYGICLASLRIASEGNKIENIYKIVYLCDKYLS